MQNEPTPAEQDGMIDGATGTERKEVLPIPREDHIPETGSEVERAVMMVLLDGRPLLARSELVREVAGSSGERGGDVGDAIEGLYAAGLIHVIEGRFLFASRAARRADGLGL